MSRTAREALDGADELVVAAVSWFELAWLARHERIVVNIPIRSWLDGLAAEVQTIGVTPAIADTAVALPSFFPGDPADRLIYATAVEHDLPLVSEDRAMRQNTRSRPPVIW